MKKYFTNKYFKVLFEDGTIGLFDSNDEEIINTVANFHESRGSKVYEVTEEEYFELEEQLLFA